MISVRESTKSRKNQIEQDMAPFGFLDDGIDDITGSFTDKDGDRWHTDEYGDRAYMGVLLMDLDDQLKLGHLLLYERKCRVCGATKI